MTGGETSANAATSIGTEKAAATPTASGSATSVAGEALAGGATAGAAAGAGAAAEERAGTGSTEEAEVRKLHPQTHTTNNNSTWDQSAEDLKLLSAQLNCALVMQRCSCRHPGCAVEKRLNNFGCGCYFIFYWISGQCCWELLSIRSNVDGFAIVSVGIQQHRLELALLSARLIYIPECLAWCVK